MTPEETKKQFSKLHEEWLRHPVTRQAIDIIVNRYDEYKKTLQENILVESNPAKESNLRIAMSTCQAIQTLLTQTDKFVDRIK